MRTLGGMMCARHMISLENSRCNNVKRKSPGENMKRTRVMERNLKDESAWECGKLLMYV